MLLMLMHFALMHSESVYQQYQDIAHLHTLTSHFKY